MSDAPPPGWGQPQGPPPGQGYPAQPPSGPGTPPPPPPVPQVPGQVPAVGSLPASGRPYSDQPYGDDPGPPPRKGRGGLIAILALVLIVVLGGVAIVLLLRAGGEDPDPVATSSQGETSGATDPADDGASDAPDAVGPPLGTEVPTDGTAPDTPPVAPGSPGAAPSDPQAPAPQGTDQSVFDLAVGTCFDDPASQSEIQSVTQIPCEAAHDNEVFGLVEFPAGSDDPFPGREAIADYGDEQCQGPVFVDYVGIDYASSRYYASQLTPTEGSWEQGDREIVCILYDSLDQITGSVRGSGR